jgi:hypothetical protein
MFKQHDEILRRIERKILDPHAKIVHDESRLRHGVARQPRSDQPPCSAVLLERLGE